MAKLAGCLCSFVAPNAHHVFHDDEARRIEITDLYKKPLSPIDNDEAGNDPELVDLLEGLALTDNVNASDLKE